MEYQDFLHFVLFATGMICLFKFFHAVNDFEFSIDLTNSDMRHFIGASRRRAHNRMVAYGILGLACSAGSAFLTDFVMLMNFVAGFGAVSVVVAFVFIMFHALRTGARG